MEQEQQQHLEPLLLEIKKRVASKNALPDEDEFINRIKLTSDSDKILLNKHFCQLEWRLGSCRMLLIYQRLSILSATEYIFTLTDAEEVQRILGYFLKSDFQLLSNTVLNSYYDSYLSDILKECFRRLIVALLDHVLLTPDRNVLTRLNYLANLRQMVPDDVFLDISLMHCNLLVGHSRCTSQLCYSNFRRWMSWTVRDEMKTYLVNIVQHNEKEIIHRLFYLVSQTDFQGWLFYIILMKMVGPLCSLNLSAFVNRHLKSLLLECAVKCDIKSLFTAIITARALCYSESANFGTFKNWYHNNVCGMHCLVDEREFINFMRCLTNIARDETDEEYLLLYISGLIPSTKAAEDYVIDFKAICNETLYLVTKGRLGKRRLPIQINIIK